MLASSQTQFSVYSSVRNIFIIVFKPAQRVNLRIIYIYTVVVVVVVVVVGGGKQRSSLKVRGTAFRLAAKIKFNPPSRLLIPHVRALKPQDRRSPAVVVVVDGELPESRRKFFHKC